MKRWRFFVYELLTPDGAVAYVGKGSGYRLAVQRRRFGLEGREVARFRRETDAYSFERVRIAECAPVLNKHPGGNGSRAIKIRERKPKWVSDIEAIGTRVYVARAWLGFYYGCLASGVKFPGDASKLDAIRGVALGAG